MKRSTKKYRLFTVFITTSVMRSGNNATLNVNNPNLANGMYMVKVKTSEQEKTIKLIIKK